MRERETAKKRGRKDETNSPPGYQATDSQVFGSCYLAKESRGLRGFPGGPSGKETPYQCRRPGFHPWVGKIPWRREWQPAPVFLPGESHGQRSLVVSQRVRHDRSDLAHTHGH